METNLNNRVNEILVANGLDFNILKVPFIGVLTSGPDEAGFTTVKQIPSEYYGLYNDKLNKIIHSVKGSYTVSQNSEIVEMVLRGAENFGELNVSKAGSLHEGRKVFIQLEVEGFANIGNGDKIKRYITVIDSNDGSTGLGVGIGTLTMSCQNQFYKFYKEGTMRAIHTASIERKIKELPYLITDALKREMQLMETFRKFESTAVSRDLANKMVNYLLGFDKTSPMSVLSELSTRSVNAMDELYTNIGIETAEKGQNLWGVFSGVTRWTTHTKSAPRRENGRIESVMVGTNYGVNEKAFTFALEHV